jgi:type IV pilus assembly protein PilN
MIRINLIPAAEAQKAEGRRQELATGALAFGTAALLFVLAHTWQHAQTSSAEREIGRLQQELVLIQGSYLDVTRMEQQKKELKERLRVIGELEARKVGPVHVLEDLSAASPDKLWVTEFTEAGGTLKLVGVGVDEQTVADFLRRLGTSAYYRGVDLDETSMVDQDGVKHKKFSIRANVNYLGAKAGAATAAGETPDATAHAGRPAEPPAPAAKGGHP